MDDSIALVMEGGGFRAAYTTGALKWLYDNGFKFKYAVSISATAAFAFFYMVDDVELMEELSTDKIRDEHMIGLLPILTEGSICGFDHMRRTYLLPGYEERLQKLLDSDRDLEIGLYNMSRQELQYKGKKDYDHDGQLIKASCTLPISGPMTEIDGEKYLDGGIEVMVSIDRALSQGHEKALVIVTKDKNYVRKPNGFFLRMLLRIVYHRYPKMLAQLDKRTEAYYDQMGKVEQLEKEGKAILIRPSDNCGVGRFSGSREQLKKLFSVGWQDMEDRKEELYKFLGKEK